MILGKLGAEKLLDHKIMLATLITIYAHYINCYGVTLMQVAVQQLGQVIHLAMFWAAQYLSKVRPIMHIS